MKEEKALAASLTKDAITNNPSSSSIISQEVFDKLLALLWKGKEASSYNL